MCRAPSLLVRHLVKRHGSSSRYTMPNGELRFPFETMAVVHVKTAALNGKRSKIKLQIFDTALRLVRPCCMQHVSMVCGRVSFSTC